MLCSGIFTKLSAEETTLDFDCEDKGAELLTKLDEELCTELIAAEETPMLVTIDDCSLLDANGVEVLDDGDAPGEEPPPPQAVRKVIKNTQTILSSYLVRLIKFPTTFLTVSFSCDAPAHITPVIPTRLAAWRR